MNDVRFGKFLVLLNGAVPLALLGWDAWHHELGANPTNFAIRTTGTMTLVFLSLTLLITPLRKVTGWNWLIFFRRTLGLYAFFYVLAHFSLFFVFDRGLDIGDTISEIYKRTYLWIGTTGLVLMIPLAVTSTNGMVKRLGAKRWKSLHRLVYVSAIAGAIHYYLLVKADVRLPIAFAVVISILLGYRVVTAISKRVTNRSMHVAANPASAVAARGNRPKFWSGKMKVARIFQETPTVKTFRLVNPAGGALPFDYQPGQYLNIALPIDGKMVRRSYTLASTPTRNGYCELTVKREEAGTSSRHLHDAVREGDLLQISAPAGSFTFNGTQGDAIVLLGAGVGVTPLISVVRYLTDIGWPGQIHLLHCVRSEKDRIFRAELEYLERRHSNLQVTITHTRPERPEMNALRGRITADLLQRTVPELTSRLFHICGPDEMMSATKQMLVMLGVPESRIKIEAFTRPVSDESADTTSEMDGLDGTASMNGDSAAMLNGAATDVIFTLARKTVSVPTGQTILEAAEECGVGIDFECRSGICGTCKKRLVSGNVFMEVRDGLSKADRMAGIILACQAKPRGPVEIEA